jgi:hypothetical protein
MQQRYEFYDKTRTECTAANERFGATAGGSADLKGSTEIPPLRQAATPLAAMRRERGRESAVPKRKYHLKK